MRALANSTRLYPGRVSGRRAQHTVNLTDYLSVPPAEMEREEEGEEFDMQDAAGMGGTRVNSDLYDSLITEPWPSNARRATASPCSAI